MRPMRHAKSVLGLALLGLFPSAVFGQSIQTLIKKNDTIIGLGGMVGMTYVAVNDSKTWMALLSTSFPDSTRDGCLLSNGFVTLREGSPLFAPVGSILDEWNSISLTNRGDLGMIIKARPSVGLPVDGAFRNLVPVALKDQVIVSPNLGAGADWETFAVVKMNSNNEMFVLGEVANPAVTRNKERTLVRYRLDDLGNILETTVLATEGMTVATGLRLAGSQCLGNNEHILSVNERGDFITFIASDSPSVQQLAINMQTVVAQSGGPSSVGKPWRVLTLSRVAINDRGDYVVTGSVGQANDPDGFLIEKNGQKFAQSDDILEGITRLGNGTQAPLYIANTGDVFWHARGSTGDAFMRNYSPIVHAGRTIVGGNLVTSLSGSENAFSISPNGRFFAANVELQTVGTAALFMDFGLILELPGCSGNPGKLRRVSGSALLGGEFQLSMDQGQVAGALTSLFFSSRALQSPAGCGVNIPPYGELMIAPPVRGPLSLPAWDGTNPALTTIRIPNRISLLDSVFFIQGLFFSPGHPTEPFRLTNAMRVEIGAP